MNDFGSISVAVLAGLTPSIVLAATFYLARRKDRDELIRKDAANEMATKNALQEAAEALHAAQEAKQGAIILKESFHLYQINQERTMSRFVTSEGLSHIESRIMEAIRDLGRRIDDLADRRD